PLTYCFDVQDSNVPNLAAGAYAGFRMNAAAGVGGAVWVDRFEVSPITGTVGGTLPFVQVLDGSSSIANGGSVTFASTPVGTPVTKTFTVKNVGTQTLTLGALSALPAGFTLVQGLASTTVAPGASTTFQIGLTAAAAGSYSGLLSFTTTDPNPPSYSFTIS